MPQVMLIAKVYQYNDGMKKILPVIILIFVTASTPSRAGDGTSLALAFQREITHRLDIPQEAQTSYAQLLEAALSNAGTRIITPQYVLLLDRNPYVQAIFLYWLDSQALLDRLHFIGASPASTGKPGEYDYFITPQGVFSHTPDNRDFRAEGTRNKLGIRGFGVKGMRVYDFGWVQGERGWGRGGLSPMRLLMHSTDPDFLEQHLGEPMSKGCIRIPATLNTFIDRYGILDADYERALASGKRLWMIRPGRTPTPWSGRYLVVADSGRSERPAWSPKPPAITRQVEP